MEVRFDVEHNIYILENNGKKLELSQEEALKAKELLAAKLQETPTLFQDKK